MASDAGAFLHNVKRNLLTLEINTIIKDNITAEPMPPVPHALLDIAGEYTRKLESLGTNVAGFFAVPEAEIAAHGPISPVGGLALAPDGALLDTDLLTVSRNTFDCLRWAAKETGIAAAGAFATMSSRDLVVVERICNNCDVLKGIIDRTPGLTPAGSAPMNRTALLARADGGASLAEGMSGGDFLALRKMWEIGTEDVVAQTVIQLDGDVVTRIGQSHIDHPGIKTLLTLHEQGIGVAVSSWRHLLTIVEEIAAGAFKTFQRLF